MSDQAFFDWVVKWQIGPGMNDNRSRVFREKYRAEHGLAPLPPEGLYSGVDGTVGPGWVPILDELASTLTGLGWTGAVDQIKEKLGTLRFYARPEGVSKEFYEAFRTAIRSAEAASATTCEVCGAPGTSGPRPGRYWILTLCDTCRSTPVIESMYA